ncbi:MULTISPECIES: M16 family metallopeptidase [Amycolatopsis]|uniref:Pitrilysin family protein n=1 Tax=Amycolatopsis albidoflavus TaxID=102226 RepID=A0ABW5HSY1_9PSEU
MSQVQDRMRTVHRVTLASGLRVVIEPDHRHDLVAVALTAGSGSRDDPPHARGLAHLVEHLMFPREQDGLAGHLHTVEAAGGLCDANTFRDHTSYFSVADADSLEPLLNAEAARLVRFAPDQRALDGELPVIEEEIRGAMFASHGGFPWTAAASALWGPDCHTGGDHGIMTHLRAVTPAEATAFHRAHYTAGNLVLSIVGAVDPVRAEATARAAFGEFTPGDRPPRPPLIARQGVRAVHTAKHFRGTALAIATPLPDAADPAGYIAHAVLAEVLSAARLPRWRECQSRLRSATIRCGFNGEWFNTASPDLLVTTLLRERDWPAREVIAEWSGLLGELSSVGPGKGELQRAIALLLLGHHRQLDSLVTRAVAHGRFAVLFPSLDGPHQIPRLLSATTARQVADAAATVRTAPAAWVELIGGAR